MGRGLVNTVRGHLPVASLGWTLPHEHITVGLSGALLDPRVQFDRPATEAKAVDFLRCARDRGLRSMVDMTTMEMGRDPQMLKRISEAADVNIVCATGLFTDELGIPQHFRYLSEDELTEIFVTEIVSGIGQTGIRAGVVKAATGHRQLTAIEEKLLRAVGQAQLRTGVPILTHTGRGGGGERQIEIFLEMGVAPEKIVIGHSDVSGDLKYHLKLLKTGVFVGFDRVGQEAFQSDGVRAGCIATLIHMGYAPQLTMSLDAHVTWLGRPNELVMTERKFTYLQDQFFPRLYKFGIKEDDLTAIMTDNVAKLFSSTK
jgi:phosphotriesterase-related protein